MLGSKLSSSIIKFSRSLSTSGEWVSPKVGRPPRRTTAEFSDEPSYAYPNCIMDPGDSKMFKLHVAKEGDVKWRNAETDNEYWDFIEQYRESVPSIDLGFGNLETLIRFYAYGNLEIGEFQGKISAAKLTVPDAIYPGIISVGGILVWPKARGQKLFNFCHLHNLKSEVPGTNYFLQNIPGLEEAYYRDWGYRYVPDRLVYYEGKFQPTHTVRELMKIRDTSKYQIKNIAEIPIESLQKFDKAFHYQTKYRRMVMKHVWKVQPGTTGICVCDNYGEVLGVACVTPCNDIQLLGPIYSVEDDVSTLLFDLLPCILMDANVGVSLPESNEFGRKCFEDRGLKALANSALMFRLKTPKECIMPGKNVLGISISSYGGFLMC